MRRGLPPHQAWSDGHQRDLRRRRQGDFDLALQRSKHYEVLPGWRENWERALQLYLAWEAAERGNAGACARSWTPPGLFLALRWNGSCNYGMHSWCALRAALAQASAGGRDARAWLAELAPEREAGALLAAYDLAQPDPAGRAMLAVQLQEKLAKLKRLVDEGDPEASLLSTWKR